MSYFLLLPGVFILTAIANRFRIKQVSLREQFIMAYGGLRGAVSFSLVEMLLPSVIHPRQMFVTTTLAVILFTVFIQVKTFFFHDPHQSASGMLIYFCWGF
jgi:NhaP-type Na+/H+ or K+/H+ antiporter